MINKIKTWFSPESPYVPYVIRTTIVPRVGYELGQDGTTMGETTHVLIIDVPTPTALWTLQYSYNPINGLVGSWWRTSVYPLFKSAPKPDTYNKEVADAVAKKIRELHRTTTKETL